MASSDKSATFSINLEDNVSGKADDAASALTALRDRVTKGDEALKDMNASLRRLKGSSDEVKAAKEELKGKIAAEQSAITQANLALLKAGTSYDTLAKAAKKTGGEIKPATDKTTSLGSAIKAAGGPIESMKGKFEALKGLAGESGGAMRFAAIAAGVLAGAILAVVAAATAGAIALGKWVLGAANAARTSNLFREAATGSAANAAAMGTQIDALADKIPTLKGPLNELANSLALNGVQGQTLVDTFNAVAQASAALGDSAGNKLREFVERGRLSQRMFISPQELQGTGLAFDDVAKQIAVSMGVGIDKARAALFEGRVKLGDGAKALRAAVESRFGDINIRRMSDLNVVADKFKEKVAGLAKDVNLEPLNQALSRMMKLFDESTFSGVALKKLITLFGDGLGKTIKFVSPFAEQFFKGLIIGALDLTIGILQLRNRLRETFAGSSFFQNLDLMSLSLTAGKTALSLIAAAFVALGAAVTLAVAPLIAAGAAYVWLQEQSEAFGKLLKATDWGQLGTDIVDGLVGGLKTGGGRIVEAVRGLGTSAKAAFKVALGIASPSKEFAKLGQFTAEGFAVGVDAGAPKAARSLESMAAAPDGASAGAAGGKAGGGVAISVPVNIIVQGGGNGQQIGQQIVDSGFLAQLTKAIEDAVKTAGIPVTT